MMETEEDAKDTCLDLRLKKRTFRNLPVKARIKTEPVVRSYFPVPPAIPQFPIIPFPVVPVDLSNYGYIANTQVDAAVNSSAEVANLPESQELSNDDLEKAVEDGTDGGKGVAGVRKDTRKVRLRFITIFLLINKYYIDSIHPTCPRRFSTQT